MLDFSNNVGSWTAGIYKRCGAGKERKTFERVKDHRLNVLFNAVSEIKFPEGKYGHPLFYRHFVSNLCEYAKTAFHFINITIENTRELK